MVETQQMRPRPVVLRTGTGNEVVDYAQPEMSISSHSRAEPAASTKNAEPGFDYLDIPAGELSAFDPREEPVTSQREPPDGAVVQWLQKASSHRPFVRLDTGEQVLIDTGSSLGFAIHDAYARDSRVRASAVYDVDGSVSTRRGTPRTVSIGSLVLRNIPTDVISGAPAETPALLGLNALRPFRMRFDPLHRLIEIAPAEQ
jgi:hypothetical protein